ncbi:Signal transduction histidine kinase [Filimonas lacunae]|uniref:histidine kinase n=1 Tax=Filimonas lacunae TaxID=477680 RepID=A0A173MH46_9BACT|nr:two-component regulator propeller domain-containing protein [Filimonas lacunae]BAV06751.1 DNA-binding response regulator, AraC family [Filimonas lacunae]SIT34413.1 Signal transduction histidine kinase [Filimonas lacunae]
MRICTWIAFAVILISLPVVRLQAQSSQINFTSLTAQNGLSYNTINAILKDKYGWMWFATDDGLNRFDGTRFTIYRHKEGDSASLPDNNITCMHEDRKGNLWVGSGRGNVCMYDRKRDVFVSVKGYKNANALDNCVRSLHDDYSGKIWVASFTGIHIIDPLALTVAPLPLITLAGKTPADKLAMCIYEDSHKQTWVGTNHGLYLYNRSLNKFQQFQRGNSVAGNLVCDSINCLAEDKNGKLWVCTENGVSMLQPGSNRFVNYRQPEADAGLNGNVMYSLAADSSGQLWIGTENGLAILTPATGRIQRILPDARSVYSLRNKSVRAVYIDNSQGIYWLGCYLGGINKYDKNLNLFQLKQSNAFDAHGLSAPLVTSFAEGDNGNVYVGTDGGGLNLYSRATGLFNHLTVGKAAESGRLAILSLEKDRQGDIWIGTFGKGLFRYHPATGASQQFTKATGKEAIRSNDIFSLLADSRGLLWIGTNGGGTDVYDTRTNRMLYHYTRTPVAPDDRPLPLNGYIRGIQEDKEGRIWMGSCGTGIVRLNTVTGQCDVYNNANSQLPSMDVRCMLYDSKGRLWVGTGNGLSLFDAVLQRFTTYNEKQGLANAVIHDIVEGDNGVVWVSTNNGISSFTTSSSRFTNYMHYNGVQNNNFVMRSGIRAADGEIFFGGLDGFNSFYPSALKQNHNMPAVVLTDLHVANQSVSPAEKGPIQEHISTAGVMHLRYGQNFALSFAALDFTSPEQNRYAYRLEGFDNDWVDAGSHQTASYTNIDPGEYVFQVKACNNDGVWNSNGARIRIVIDPPFWRTTTAYVLYVLLIAGILLYSRYRTLQRLRRKFAAEQEKLMARQQMEQERKQAEMARELDQLKIKFLTNLSHEFRTPISLIMGPVDNLLSKKQDQASAGQLGMVKRNARRLLNLVNQLLDFRRLEEHELTLQPLPGEMIGFIREVFDSFTDLADRKKICYQLDCDTSSLIVAFDHNKLERILFNLLSNAFKFTPAGGAIQLVVKKEEKVTEDVATTWLSIAVSDTGMGIPEEKQARIFERYFQSHAANALLTQGTGIGLSITKEFVQMHGGTIEVSSKPARGSTFTIQLPFTIVQPVTDSLPALPEPKVLPMQPVEQLPEKEGDTARTTLLLVEDNDDFRFYLKDNLKANYHIIEARNGKEGWQKALAVHPQLIVSDINMPEMDGLQLCRKIRSDKRTCHIPVILLTALPGEATELKGLETGASDYLTKPFNVELLHARVHNLLQMNRRLKDTFTKQLKVTGPEVEIDSDNARFLQRVVLFIEENLNDASLSVEALSKHLGLSRSTLYSRMVELTGNTPVEFIRNIKLDKAAVLLEKSDMNIAQVAYSTGFSTPNYFTRAFKTRFNMQPSEFLQQKRKPASHTTE